MTRRPLSGSEKRARRMSRQSEPYRRPVPVPEWVVQTDEEWVRLLRAAEFGCMRCGKSMGSFVPVYIAPAGLQSPGWHAWACRECLSQAGRPVRPGRNHVGNSGALDVVSGWWWPLSGLLEHQ